MLRLRHGGRRRHRGMSLIEIMLAAGVLAVTMLGVASAYNVISISQRQNQERTAVLLAAQAMMDEIDAYVQLNSSSWQSVIDDKDEATPDTTPGLFDKCGFHIYLGGQGADDGAIGTGGIAIGDQATTTLGAARLKPASDASLFPASRATVTSALDKPGYITILGPADADVNSGPIPELDVLVIDPDFDGNYGTGTANQSDRDDLRVVVVTVAWGSYGGDQVLRFTTMVTNQ